MLSEYAKPFLGEKGSYTSHIAECHRLWQEFFQSRSVALAKFCDNVGISLEELQRKTKRAVLFHDAGKLLPNFQKQMERLINHQPPDSSLYFRHELASALLMLIADKEHLSQSNRTFPYDILAVLGHHKTINSDWRSFEREKICKSLPALGEEQINRVLEIANQYGICESIDNRQASKMFHSPQWVYGLLYTLQDFLKPTKFNNASKEELKNLRLIYAVIKGLLMTCDWMASATKEASKIPVNHSLNSDDLRRKMKAKVEKEGRAYVERSFHAECEQQSGHILAIAPTGTGKTEAALLWATHGDPAKIIFLMPTMVTSNSLYNRMQNNYFGKNECGLIHSGADTFFAQQDNLEHDNTHQDFRLELQQYRAFLSPVMIATVDQILTSGFNIGPWCQKEWALVGSRVIFDEIHAYQPFTLGLITAVIEKIKILGGHVCLMSATMPAFLREHFQQLLAIKSPIVATESMQRQKCHWQYRDASIEPMEEEIRDYLNNGRKVAIVFNTVKDAQTAYRKWKKILGENRILCYHSQFTMKDRQEKENKLQDKDDNGHSKHFDLVIATQAIEVSLDISFDVMYSECAPLDSLIQRAGRCNRYAKPGEYYFIVFSISKIAYEFVYEKAQKEIDRTIEILYQNQKHLREDELEDMLEFVYSGVRLGNENPNFQEGYLFYDTLAVSINGQGFIYDLSVSEETITRKMDFLKVNIIPNCFYGEVKEHWQKKQYPLIRLYEVPISEWRQRKLKEIENQMQLPIFEVPYSSEEGIIDSQDDLPLRFV